MTTPISDDDLLALREKAEAAQKVAPGPWEVCAADDYFVEASYKNRPKGVCEFNLYDTAICEVANSPEDFGEAFAAHIAAANPSTILRLLDELSSARAERAALRAEQEATNETLLDVWEQFACPSQNGLWSGGLSTLEWVEGHLRARKLIDADGNRVACGAALGTGGAQAGGEAHEH